MKASLLLLLLLHLLVAPGPASSQLFPKPVDCNDIRPRSSGVHAIFPAGKWSVTVMCDMDTDTGGWTVISARIDGTLNFYRPWNDYKVGFGWPVSEYWIGLDNLHYLTSQKKYELRVVLEDFDGNTKFASYGSFSVGDEFSGYQLTVGDFNRNGGAGNALYVHNQMKFTTWDRDNDRNEDGNCAKIKLGAFWYDNCGHTNPNGVYYWGTDGIYVVGITWNPWKRSYYSLKKYIMMIRPLDD